MLLCTRCNININHNHNIECLCSSRYVYSHFYTRMCYWVEIKKYNLFIKDNVIRYLGIYNFSGYTPKKIWVDFKKNKDEIVITCDFPMSLITVKDLILINIVKDKTFNIFLNMIH